MLIKKHLNSLITKQLSYEVVRDLKDQKFAFPGLKTCAKKGPLPVPETAPESPIELKPGKEASEGHTFISYMSSTCD